MKKQEWFEKAVIHLLQQGKRSAHNGNVCAYRTKTGLRCAVGALLTIDNEAIAALEGECVDDHRVVQALLDSGIELDEESARRADPNYDQPNGVVPDDLALLENLQLIHDVNEVKDWPWTLEDLCKKHPGVEWTPVLEAAAKAFVIRR